MAKSRSYVSDLIESLKDPVEAAEYLNAALEDEEPEVFLLALKDVVNSYGGMTKLAESTSLNRENLYRMLSSKGNPEFFSLLSVLDAVGFRLAVEPKVSGTKTLVLHTSVQQVREESAKYALAADSEPNQATEVRIRTAQNQDIGALVFQFKEAILGIRLNPDISIGEVTNALVEKHDGTTLDADASMLENNFLVLLRRKKIFPEDVARIILTTKP